VSIPTVAENTRFVSRPLMSDTYLSVHHTTPVEPLEGSKPA